MCVYLDKWVYVLRPNNIFKNCHLLLHPAEQAQYWQPALSDICSETDGENKQILMHASISFRLSSGFDSFLLCCVPWFLAVYSQC